jgi:hypothetical protein
MLKKLITGFVLACILSTASAGIITTLLLNVTAPGAGTGVNYSSFNPSIPQPNVWFQAILTGASAVSATVEIDGSTDNRNWVSLGSIALTLAAPTSAVQITTTAPFIRGNVTAISGIGETVTLMSGE